MFMKIISSVKFSKRRVDVSQIEGKEEQSVASQVIDVAAICTILVDVKRGCVVLESGVSTGILI